MKLPLGKNPYFKAIEVLWSYWVLCLNPSFVKDGFSVHDQTSLKSMSK